MKNLLLPVVMLCTCLSAFAQLHVSPNTTAATDSYVFVKDQILYVEQDINLVRNTNDATTVSSIYLRDESQLIQGESGATANSGTGWLSVYQESNSDSYDYNYWASPVGGSPGATAGNRNFRLLRMADSLSVTDSEYAYYTYEHNGYSSPNLTISMTWFDSWNPTTQSWSWIGPSGTIPAGYGFTMKGTNETTAIDGTTTDQDANNQRYEFRGRPFNGDITVPVQTSAIPFQNTVEDYYYFTLSGNPYASALDLKDVFYETGNEEIIQFAYWDEDRSINSHYYLDNKGGYGTWVPGPEADDTNAGLYVRPNFMNYDADGDPTTDTGVDGEIIERRYAPIGQGFMIVSDSLDLGIQTVTIKNSHRQYVKEGAANLSEHKFGENNETSNKFTGPITTPGGDDPAPDNSEFYTPHLRLNAIFGDNSHFREMILAFHDTATDNFDRGMDARHPMDGAISESYMPLRYGNQDDGDPDKFDRNLVIQTVPYDDIRKRVPIAFQLDNQETIELMAIDEVNLPFSKAYLYDSANNSYQQITAGESASLNLYPGIYEGRFFITFRGPYIDTDVSLGEEINEAKRDLLANVDFVQNNPSATLQVNNPEGFNVKDLSIFDMTGKLVLTQQNLGQQNRLSFPTGNFADGIYLVRLTTSDNLKVDYKINVINK
ncbi:MAG: T9SS type A sorting domain-containing protein [Bacteroidetes bacterium]|nr:T9SS type A sorting domain-containing protein [Bacteroidota bacterium]